MKKIEVFDPSLCCSTGVCGVEVDQALVTFAADVDWAKQNGARRSSATTWHSSHRRLPTMRPSKDFCSAPVRMRYH